MPNPGGVNNFNRFSAEPAYGEVTQQKQLQQAYPVPGQAPINAPRRDQKRAVRGQQPQPQAGPPMPSPQEINPQMTTAMMWQAIAATPGASPLVQRMASEAQQSG